MVQTDDRHPPRRRRARYELITLVAVLIVSVLAVAPAARAQTTRCRLDRWLVNRNAFPSISELRAINLPRFTARYAPRCLVANSLASDIQYFWSARHRFPRTARPYGARWRAPKFTIRYYVKPLKSEPGNSYMYAVAKAGRRQITMHLGS
jgi:hypothetical protein